MFLFSVKLGVFPYQRFSIRPDRIRWNIIVKRCQIYDLFAIDIVGTLSRVVQLFKDPVQLCKTDGGIPDIYKRPLHIPCEVSFGFDGSGVESNRRLAQELSVATGKELICEGVYRLNR